MKGSDGEGGDTCTLYLQSHMTNESTFYHATYISMHSYLRTLTISYVYVCTTCVAVWVGINISNYGQTECQHIGVCGEDED